MSGEEEKNHLPGPGSDQDADDLDADADEEVVDISDMDTSAKEEDDKEETGVQPKASSSNPKAASNQQVLRGRNYCFTKEQVTKLKELFKKSNTISGNQAGTLAQEFKCEPLQIMNWFGGARRTARQKPKAQKPRKRRAHYKLWETELLKKIYATTKYPSQEELKSLAKKCDKKDAEQIRVWFSNQRKNDGVTERMEPQALPQQTPSPNTTPILFFEEKKKINWRPLNPSESTVNYEYIYSTQWRNGALGKDNTSVGLSNKCLPVEAAEENWKQVKDAVKQIADDKLSKDKKACSYRLDVILDDLTCDPSTAVSSGVYCSNRKVAAIVKWYFRLRFLSMGTFHPTECLDSLRLAVPELERTAQLMKPYLAPRNIRWMDFSADSFQKYMENGAKKEECPSLDKELILRFEVKERTGFDFAIISAGLVELILNEQKVKTEEPEVMTEEPEAKTEEPEAV